MRNPGSHITVRCGSNPTGRCQLHTVSIFTVRAHGQYGRDFGICDWPENVTVDLMILDQYDFCRTIPFDEPSLRL